MPKFSVELLHVKPHPRAQILWHAQRLSVASIQLRSPSRRAVILQPNRHSSEGSIKYSPCFAIFSGFLRGPACSLRSLAFRHAKNLAYVLRAVNRPLTASRICENFYMRCAMFGARLRFKACHPGRSLAQPVRAKRGRSVNFSRRESRDLGNTGASSDKRWARVPWVPEASSDRLKVAHTF